MGRKVLSEETYTKAVRSHAPDATSGRSVTARAEQQAHATGKLNPLVDPAGYGLIRRSLPRFEQQPNGLWQLTVGCPMDVETIVDSTGSMGNSVDIALRVLPDAFALCSEQLPDFDLQVMTGTFGDCQSDTFPMCRPQFEMEADKIVQQITLMVPERKGGGNGGEDPHYAMFGAAYLTAAHTNRLGFKGFHFTVSDEPVHEELSPDQLVRIYGPQVFDKVTENGHRINRYGLTAASVARDLLKRAHAFFLQVDSHSSTTSSWKEVYGHERVVMLPNTEYLPQVQAVIIGLTQGTLSLSNVRRYLRKHGMDQHDAAKIAESVANIPLGAQIPLLTALPRELPKAGDLFRNKTDLWPLTAKEIAELVPEGGAPAEDPDGNINWI